MKKKLVLAFAIALSSLSVHAQWNLATTPLKGQYKTVEVAAPSVVYASTHSSISKSTDGGISWNYVSKTFSNYNASKSFLFDGPDYGMHFFDANEGFIFGRA